MQIEVKSIGTQAAGLWATMKPLQKALIVTVLVLVAGGLAYASFGRPEPAYAVLFSQLGQDDAAGIVEALKEEKVPYHIEAGGSAITVPADQVQETRLSLASKGIPRGGGVGFEIFDKQSFATTSFVEEMNYRRALAGELSRTIASLDPIEHARVHIAMQERSLYRKEENAPAVSVAVRLRPGRSLSQSQLKGIVHLVSSSVAKLTPDRVTVVDESGAVLWAGEENGEATAKQREIEKTLRERIREIMDRVVGPGQSVVVVTATMDTAQKERTEELFDKDSAVLRSQSRTEQTRYSNAPTGGLTGVKGNLPESAETPSAPPSDGRLPKDSRLSETKNYEVNRVTNRIVEDPVKVKRLHIAILINGALESSTASAAGSLVGSEVGGQRVAVNLQRIAALVREAAGLDMDRGDRLEVHSIPFADDHELAQAAATGTVTAAVPPTLETWHLFAAGGGALLLLVIAAMSVVGGRRRRRAAIEQSSSGLALPASVDQIQNALGGGATAALEAPKPPTRERVREAVRRDAGRAARILSAWLQETEETT